MNNTETAAPSTLKEHRKYPKWLSVLAIATAVSAYSVIVFGSHVRVTESGMGCPDWPLCSGQIGPIYEFHALMEQVHRYLAGLVSLLVGATAVVAIRYRDERHATVKPALFMVAMLVVQVILGGVTVFAGNGSPTVALHLVAGMALLAGAVVTAVCTLVPCRETSGPRLSTVGWVAVAAISVLLTSGSLVVDAGAEAACASVPLCPTGSPPPLVALHVFHRGVAVLAVIVTVTFAVHAWRQWAGLRGVRPLAVSVIGLLLLTAGVGMVSAVLMAPPEWADLHLAAAAATLAAVLSLAVLGWLTGADAQNCAPDIDLRDPGDLTQTQPDRTGPTQAR